MFFKQMKNISAVISVINCYSSAQKKTGPAIQHFFLLLRCLTWWLNIKIFSKCGHLTFSVTYKKKMVKKNNTCITNTDLCEDFLYTPWPYFIYIVVAWDAEVLIEEL